MTSAVSVPYLLRASDTCVLLVVDAPGQMPRIVHWGADLGPLSDDEIADLVRAATPVVSHSAYDRVQRIGLLPEAAATYAGHPGIEGFRVAGESAAVTPDFTAWTLVAGADRTLSWRAADHDSGLALESDLELTRSGVVRLRHTVTNTGSGAYALNALRAALPLSSAATELLDLTGRWCRERSPQRRPLDQGSWVRESRRGRTGHDASLVMAAGTPGFGFGHGEVWAVHVAWSGDHVIYAERLPEAAAYLGGAELLGPGEVVLAEGESYQTPWLVAAWSDVGLDGLTDRLHQWVRARPGHPVTPRPVVLNTWEAVYFDQDVDTLKGLADAAAQLGIERFVLDDGWFRGRVDDTVGLGDWTVDADRWPAGLHPLIDHVKALGLDFGLWVEPEMINLDSEAARAHPEWVLRGRGQLPPTWRHQHVIDMQNPAAYAHVRDALLALLSEYDIAYLKWDHNRDLTDAGHDGRPAVHGQTLAFYALLDELRAAHPALEIESCASGGGRVDLEVLERTDRIWTSDCNDALERQSIQRWTELLVPPELVGAHVGATTAHTTRRTHTLGFRALTALFGHFGVEWDITAIGEDERAELAAWIALYKDSRGLLHSGRVVRGDHPDPALWVHGVVSHDQSEALFAVVGMASSQTSLPLPVRIGGLDPERRYAVELVELSTPAAGAYHGPAGIESSTVTLSGRVLASVGLTIPVVLPESGRLIRLVATT